MMFSILKNVHMRRTSSKSNVNCCVYNCHAVNKKNPELSYHKFPPKGQKIKVRDSFGQDSEIDRRRLWEIKLKMGKPVTPYMHVCSRHFSDEDYLTPNEDCYAKRILKKTAVPTKNLPLMGTSTNLNHDAEKKKKEERFKRLCERRKIDYDKISETCDIVNDNTQESFSAVTQESSTSCNRDIEVAAEALLELGTVAAESKHSVDKSTQTDETFVEQIVRPKTLKSVSVQVNTTWFMITDYITTDYALKVLTGIPSFLILQTIANLQLVIQPDARVRRLSLKERIILVFLKLKLDLTFAALGVLFGNITVPTVKKMFTDTVLILAYILKSTIIFPSKEEILKNMPMCFRKYQKVRIVLDCTEIRVQNPKKLCCKIKMYSHYKKHTTIKFMTGVSPAGLITYVSQPYGGRASDKIIFEQSGLLERLEPYIDHIMVDKGFLIDNVCNDYAIQIVRPPFLRKKKQFDKEESLKNCSIASARVHIERVNARIKIFRVLRNTLPLHLVPFVNDIFLIICGITNLSSPIIADNLFLNHNVDI